MSLDKYAYPTTQDHYGHWDRCGLTAREHACIQLKVPQSGDPELDSLIRASLRADIAKAAMQGLLSESPDWATNMDGAALYATMHADQFLSALEAPGGAG